MYLAVSLLAAVACGVRRLAASPLAFSALYGPQALARFLGSSGAPPAAVIRRGRRLPAAVRESAVPGLVGGAISIAAYTIVLWAQTSGALAPIAALRETSIVFGALIGAVFLGERLGARRAIARAWCWREWCCSAFPDDSGG